VARSIASLFLVFLFVAPAAPAHGQRKPAAGKGKKGRPTQKAAQKAVHPSPPPAHPAAPGVVPAPELPAVVVERKPQEEVKAPPRPEDERELKRGERVEFDGRLIEGQTAAAGAIYLFERLPSELRSMVLERKGYRREELETLYPNGVPPGERRPMGPPGPDVGPSERTPGR
jgi:hypothetical protein